MSQLSFEVTNVAVEPHAAVPQLVATLAVEDPTATDITAIALRCIVLIEAQLRESLPDEERRLTDQFGSRERRTKSLKPMHWMQCGLLTQGFRGSSEIELPLPVTYDFEVMSSAYLHALRDGTVPLVFAFSGTVFTRGKHGSDVEQVPSRQVRYEMPISVWQDVMERYYPNSGWLRLDRDTLTALGHVKAAAGHESFDATIWSLLVAHTDAAKAQPTPGSGGKRDGDDGPRRRRRR